MGAYFDAIIHASIKDELGENLQTLRAWDVFVLRVFWRSKSSQEGLNDMVSMHTERQLLDSHPHMLNDVENILLQISVVQMQDLY